MGHSNSIFDTSCFLVIIIPSYIVWYTNYFKMYTTYVDTEKKK